MTRKDYFVKLSRLIYLIDQINYALVMISVGLGGTKEFYLQLSAIAASEEHAFPEYKNINDVMQILCDKKCFYIMELLPHFRLAKGCSEYFANAEQIKLWIMVLINVSVKAMGTDYAREVYETCHDLLNIQKRFFDAESYERIIETWLSFGYYDEADDAGNVCDGKELLN